MFEKHTLTAQLQANPEWEANIIDGDFVGICKWICYSLVGKLHSGDLPINALTQEIGVIFGMSTVWLLYTNPSDTIKDRDAQKTVYWTAPATWLTFTNHFGRNLEAFVHLSLNFYSPQLAKPKLYYVLVA